MPLRLNQKKRLDYFLGGLLLVGLKPMTLLLGRVLRRDHSAPPRGTIAVVKLLGGGSLVLAAPALLALKERFHDKKLILITTPAVRPFAEVLGHFDEILTIDDRSIATLIRDVLGIVLRWSTRIDTLLDIEVHSRATAILSLLMMARNRWGFFKESAYWRKGLYTHLIFYNTYAPTPVFYGAMVRAMGVLPHEPEKVTDLYRSRLRERDPSPLLPNAEPYVAVGFSCSDNGAERMMPLEQWAHFARSRSTQEVRRIVLLGAPSDHGKAEELGRVLREKGGFECVNLCGQADLPESFRILSRAKEFWGVDSSLLHLARLAGVNSVSFWGPTDPATRLIPNARVIDQVHRGRTACSPCIHFADIPPCLGQNECMRNIWDGGSLDRGNITWLWDDENQRSPRVIG